MLILGLAALTMAGCPTSSGPGDNGDDNEPPPGQALVQISYTGEGNVVQTADGNMVTLTAEAAEGWVFDGWSEAQVADRTAMSIVVDVTEVPSITANFLEDSEPQPRPTNACGNGVLERAEQCDDGNTVSGDGCSATCRTETPTTNRCGDGVRNIEAGEQCDDGNTVNGDGCSSRCRTEASPPGGCGDGQVNGAEECDGGGAETATCNANCTTSRCGDSIMNAQAGEQCDDGNIADGDACSSTCQNATSPPSPPPPPPPPPPPGGIPNDNCSAPINVGDGTRSYNNVGATTDGPDEPLLCNFFGRSQVASDIWYCYRASCTGTAVVSLCGSDYDTKLAVYAGCACPTSPPLACSDDDCGTAVQNVQSRVTFAATAGQSYLVRAGGYIGEQGDGRLTIGCNVDACANGSGDCSLPSPTEAPGCGDATCCTKTCQLDRFCCDVAWDDTCAGEAEGVCDGSFQACAPGTGACGAPDDNAPGCENVSCCNTVCLVDPFCCLSAWDSTCVNEAEAMCFLTCGRGAGDCRTVHLTPGCDVDACCQAVCRDDPFCCDTDWDQTCVDKASTLCP